MLCPVTDLRAAEHLAGFLLVPTHYVEDRFDRCRKASNVRVTGALRRLG